MIVFALVCLPLIADSTSDPQFTKDGELIRPTNYREWIYLTSGLGMSYGTRAASAENPPFDNVFVQPAAYRVFKETGQWPERTMFVLEIRKSDSHSSINKAGHFQSDLVSIDAAVKDASRFQGKWAYFVFSKDGQIQDKAKPLASDSACNACHSQHGAVDNTFVQFYPTLLEIARAKGTVKGGDH